MTYKPIPALSFDTLTPLYDLFAETISNRKWQRKKALEILKLKSGERVLDVGCGPGTFLVDAKQKHPYIKMAGIDIDDKILSIARLKIKKNHVDARLIKASADKLPFANSSFDAVISILVFHHLPIAVKKGAFKEIYRVMKPNARFLLIDIGRADGLYLKILYVVLKTLHIAEAKTMKDNIEGKIPLFLKQAGFVFKEVAPRRRGIQFLLARK